MTLRRPLLAFALVAGSAVSAQAESHGTHDAPAAPVSLPAPSPGPELVFSLRGGVASSPAYIGADENRFGPDLGLRFHFLRLGGREFGDPNPWAESSGLGFRGALRFIPGRDSGDYDELDGLDDIDAALELGVGVDYTARNYSAFAEIRRGFGGHESWVATAGLDAIARPSDRLRVTFGPRVFWGGDDYADTYFGITPAEASADLPAYDPDGGLLGAGLELGARYRLNDDWGLEGALTWETLRNDAEDSPIVDQGASDQWSVRFGVTRAIRLGG